MKMRIEFIFTDDDQKREYLVKANSFHPPSPSNAGTYWVKVYRKIMDSHVRDKYTPPKEVQSSEQTTKEVEE